MQNNSCRAIHEKESRYALEQKTAAAAIQAAKPVLRGSLVWILEK